MSSKDNALGRKKDRVFKAVYGPDFQSEWSEKTWTEGLSKVVIKPNHHAIFVGFVATDGIARRGFLLDANDALELAVALQRSGTLANKLGRNQ